MSHITILGTGNLATILGSALKQKGCHIVQVYGRTPRKAAELASQLGAQPVVNLDELDAAADIYIICVSDSAVGELALRLPRVGGVVVHCAGSIGIDVLQRSHARTAVLYPLQTFTATRQVDLSTTPFLVEASDDATLAEVRGVASMLSNSCTEVDSGRRLKIHLAAVFANNFTNHMAAIAGEILEREGLDFELLRPIMAETFNKMLAGTPVAAQTGPARRNDRNVMDKHIELLTCSPKWRLIYELVSQSIHELDQKKHNV